MRKIMARLSVAISDKLLERCKIALKQQGKTGEVARRLQAIISAKHHNVSKVALIFGVTRATMMKWIKDFDKEKDNYSEKKYLINTTKKRFLKLYKRIQISQQNKCKK